jgi:hypothetical protein
MMILEGSNSMQQPTLQNILESKMVTKYKVKPFWYTLQMDKGKKMWTISLDIDILPICLSET